MSANNMYVDPALTQRGLIIIDEISPFHINNLRVIKKILTKLKIKNKAILDYGRIKKAKQKRARRAAIRLRNKF